MKAMLKELAADAKKGPKGAKDEEPGSSDAELAEEALRELDPNAP